MPKVLRFELKILYIILVLAVCHLFIALKLLDVIFINQSTPYLDEVFHIPQATKYCNGSFTEWDPKITTLPGLYLLSIGILKPISWIFDEELCSVYWLRSVNLLCSTTNLLLLFSLRSKLLGHEKGFQIRVLCGSVNMAIFPLLYFFTFLYYTDQISTLLVLLMYRLLLDGRYNVSALIGCIAVCCRQTNIIWVAFFALETGLDSLNTHLLKIGKKNDGKKSIDNAELFFSTLVERPKVHLPLLKDLLWKETGFVLTGLSFFTFVWLNKGIVVGDRSAHQAVINFPQLFYFSGFVLFFCFPYTVALCKKFAMFIFDRPFFNLGLVLICCAVVATNTHVHPYLLADNRHYTFYVWKRLYEWHWITRYILAHPYIFGFYCIHHFIGHKKYSFQIAFYSCLILSLVPQKLLEFRYFIIPYLIMRLNMKGEAKWQLLLEFLLFLFINAFTIYLFLTSTFFWADSKEVQRFMW